MRWRDDVTRITEMGYALLTPEEIELLEREVEH
jgi:hypothetical protein